MRMLKKVIGLIFILVFLAVCFYGTFSAPVEAVPLPWRITVTPDKIYSAPPHCSVSFIVQVSADYDDKPIQLIFDEWSEGDWPYEPGTLISSVYFDGEGGKMPVGANYETTVTFSVVAPWKKPPGEYRIRVYAFPEGTDPYQYGAYDTITLVIVDTGIEKCDSDYWPPPPSDDDTEITADDEKDWPPPSDGEEDIITDKTNGWYWWRWWRLDWKDWQWWHFREQAWWNTWWYRWWPWSDNSDRSTTFDFRLEAFPSIQFTDPGEQVLFPIDVKHISGSPQSVALSISGLPEEISKNLSVLTADPTYSSILTIDTDSTLNPGTYPFTVVGSGGGITRTITLNLIVEEGKENTALTLAVNPSSLKTGENAVVTGVLSPALAVPVELHYFRPDGYQLTKNVSTTADGSFAEIFTPDLAGDWLVRARWFGNEEFTGCESLPAGLSVLAAAMQPSVWDILLGIITIIIAAAIISFIIFLVIKRKRRTSENS